MKELSFEISVRDLILDFPKWRCRLDGYVMGNRRMTMLFCIYISVLSVVDYVSATHAMTWADQAVQSPRREHLSRVEVYRKK